jgi:hypothetical protein
MRSKNQRKIRGDPRSFSIFFMRFDEKNILAALEYRVLRVIPTKWFFVWYAEFLSDNCIWHSIIRKRIRPIYTSNMYSCTLSRAVFAHGKPQVRKLAIVRGGRRRGRRRRRRRRRVS